MSSSEYLQRTYASTSLNAGQADCACKTHRTVDSGWCRTTVVSHVRHGDTNNWQYCDDCYDDKCPFCKDIESKFLVVNTSGDG